MSALQRVRPAIAEFIREGRGWILLTIAIGWFLSFGIRLVFPAMLPYLRAEFDLDLSMAGFLITLLWVAYGVGQLPGGMIGDRIGARTTLTLSTAVSAVTIIMVSLSVNVWMLFMGTIFFGLSTAPYGPVRLVVLSNTFQDNVGTAIGMVFAAGNLGTTVLPILGTFLATYITWHLGFMFVVPFFLVSALGLWLHIPALTNNQEKSGVVKSFAFLRRVIHATTRRPILLAAGVSLFGGFIYQGFTGLYPTYLVDIKGLSPNMAAMLLGIFFITGMIYQALSGVAVDRFGLSATLLVLFVVTSVGLFTLPFVNGLFSLVLVTIILSCLLGYQPVVQAYLAGSLPTDVKGSGLGLLRTVAFMIGAMGPVTIGVFAERGFFDEAFLLLGVLAIVGLALSVRLNSRY